jgi:hypothetical protein
MDLLTVIDRVPVASNIQMAASVNYSSMYSFLDGTFKYTISIFFFHHTPPNLSIR